jgi:hypothetical protein
MLCERRARDFFFGFAFCFLVFLTHSRIEKHQTLSHSQRHKEERENTRSAAHQKEGEGKRSEIEKKKKEEKFIL